jgi:uncharacterized protein involved in exopolysaccharide biosynthesis
MSAQSAAGLKNELSAGELIATLTGRWRVLLVAPIMAALIAYGLSYALPKTFVSQTVIIPPQQQNSALTALSQLGALSGLAGTAVGLRSPADQYVSLLHSASILDRIIDSFDLMTVYDVRFREVAREQLVERARVSLGKRDGLITIEVEDQSPQRAAEIANRFVDELRNLTGQLTLTEAQQRRVFFEAKLKETRARLTEAEVSLQSSGFNQGALRADARAAAESYARLQAEVMGAHVRLQTLRSTLSENAPEVKLALTTYSTLRAQLVRFESRAAEPASSDYLSRFREFKYQEALYDVFARQFELARLDESREGGLVQVVDRAQPAERKTKPRRVLMAAFSWFATAMVLCLYFLSLRLMGSKDPCPQVP